MSHRNTFLYEKILVWLLEYAVQHNIQVLWHHFMADFELAVKNSIQYIFGDILQWHGCYLRGEYIDPINLVLGQERAPLIAEFMT